MKMTTIGLDIAKLVAVARANKAARIAWVVMTRDESYRTPTTKRAA